MQRTTRGLFRHLARRTAVRPICWNVAGNCYQLLGQRELLILEEPFRVPARPAARPELRGEHFPAELYRLLFRKSIRLQDELDAGDVLLVPDIYRDGRIKRLPESIAASLARSVAIYHDSAALRLDLVNARGRRSFEKYMNSLAAFDLVICISQDSRADLHRFWQAHGTVPTETCVEMWPVEFDEIQRDKTEKKSNTVLCVGSLEARKNHLLLLRAAQSVWDKGLVFQLDLVGRRAGFYGRAVIAALKELQRTGYPIRWHRHVDDRALHRAYRDCAFTVYPSRMEGFGLPIAESLWHGKPCLCGGNGALGEIARGGGCLMVDQTSEEALADGIEKLLTDQESYAQLSAEARGRTFRSWSEYGDGLLRHLQVAVEGEPAVPAKTER